MIQTHLNVDVAFTDDGKLCSDKAAIGVGLEAEFGGKLTTLLLPLLLTGNFNSTIHLKQKTMIIVHNLCLGFAQCFHYS